jgi:hypothetical protein
MPGEHVAAEDRQMKVGRDNSKVLKIYCRNERCKWFNTAWTVQQRSDGTIPDALLHRPKKFPELPSWGAGSVTALEQQLALETQPGGGELNNPNG